MVGLMEALALPSREIRARFTKSDVVLWGWRSAEMSNNMRRRTHQPQQMPRLDPTQAYTDGETREFATQDDVITRLEERLGPIAYKLENEKGQVDLRRLTGEEAAHFMSSMGIPMGRM